MRLERSIMIGFVAIGAGCTVSSGKVASDSGSPSNATQDSGSGTVPAADVPMPSVPPTLTATAIGVTGEMIESISSDGTDLYMVASTTQPMSRAISRVKLSDASVTSIASLPPGLLGANYWMWTVLGAHAYFLFADYGVYDVAAGSDPAHLGADIAPISPLFSDGASVYFLQSIGGSATPVVRVLNGAGTVNAGAVTATTVLSFAAMPGAFGPAIMGSDDAGLHVLVSSSQYDPRWQATTNEVHSGALSKTGISEQTRVGGMITGVPTPPILVGGWYYMVQDSALIRVRPDTLDVETVWASPSSPARSDWGDFGIAQHGTLAATDKFILYGYVSSDDPQFPSAGTLTNVWAAVDLATGQVMGLPQDPCAVHGYVATLQNRMFVASCQDQIFELVYNPGSGVAPASYASTISTWKEAATTTSPVTCTEATACATITKWEDCAATNYCVHHECAGATTYACSTYDLGGCTLHSGCLYDTALGNCAGTPDPCPARMTFNCASEPGCSLPGGPPCVSPTSTCASLGLADCASAPNCAQKW